MRRAATATDPRLAAAQAGDEGAFRSLVGPHAGELLRHAYRMLGSHQDAEDAVQETLLQAWRALPQFAGRSSLRTWLFGIATNTSLTMSDQTRKRGVRLGPSADPTRDPPEPLIEPVWIEPLPDDIEEQWSLPERRYEEREALELAFVAAIQHLTPRQRAVLLLRDVLGFGGDEVAELLDTNRDSVYSLLQRAHQSIDRHLPAISQQQTARQLGDQALQAIVQRYIAAWEAGDADALAAMLAADAVMTMPPLPTWFSGRDAIRTFLERRPLAIPADWQLEPTRANGQLAFACYLADARERRFHALHVLTLRTDGLISELASFFPPLARPPDNGTSSGRLDPRAPDRIVDAGAGSRRQDS